MGYKCSYPGCTSGYEVKKKGKNISINTVQIWKFPSKDLYPEIYEVWKKYLNRQDFESLKNPRLCANHFDPKYIKNNRQQVDAVPTVEFNSSFNKKVAATPEKGEHFYDLPTKVTKYSFKNISKNLESSFLDEAQNALQDNKYKDALDSKFESTKHLVDYLNQITIGRRWSILNLNEKTLLLSYFPENYNMQSAISIQVDTSVDINCFEQKSNVSFFSSNGEIDKSLLRIYFTKYYVLCRPREVNGIIECFEGNYTKFLKNNSKSDFKKCVQQLENCDEFDKESCKFEWLSDQLRLIIKSENGRRYSNKMILNAFNLYIKGPNAYDQLRTLTCLPSSRTLRRLSSFLNLNPLCDFQNEEYLKNQISALKPYERIVTLKFDEINLKPSLDFHGKQVFGYAVNQSQGEKKELATSCQAFMISSFFGKYQDIVRLFPVKNQDFNDLKKFLFEVLDLLYKVGFTVIAITSDNYSTNSSLFATLCKPFHKKKDDKHEYNWFKYKDHNIIHCFFDAPHILKCIRNNWISSKTSMNTFYFPSCTQAARTCAVHSARNFIFSSIFARICADSVKSKVQFKVKVAHYKAQSIIFYYPIQFIFINIFALRWPCTEIGKIELMTQPWKLFKKKAYTA